MSFYLCGSFLHDVTTSSSNHSTTDGAATESSHIKSETINSIKHHDRLSLNSNSLKTTSKPDGESQNQNNEQPCNQNNDHNSNNTRKTLKQPKWVISSKVVLALLVLTNLPLALYTSLIHQRGTVDVVRFLSDESKYATKYNTMSVFFAMPCHSTPYYR